MVWSLVLEVETEGAYHTAWPAEDEMSPGRSEPLTQAEGRYNTNDGRNPL
jgi:hypothetical protein